MVSSAGPSLKPFPFSSVRMSSQTRRDSLPMEVELKASLRVVTDSLRLPHLDRRDLHFETPLEPMSALLPPIEVLSWLDRAQPFPVPVLDT